MRRVLALLAVLALAGCGGDEKQQAPPEEAWFTACAPATGTLPAVPCFTGGEKTSVTGPAVVNLWASWCAPCRQELPAFRRLAEKDQVKVIGVNTLDDRSRALDTARDLDFRFPNLYDPTGQLQKSTGRAGLPITLFVDSSGKVVHTYTGSALDDASLAKLVEEHL